MNYTLVPRQSVGPVRFGMSRGEVRAALGRPNSSGDRYDGLLYDSYRPLNLRVYHSPQAPHPCVAAAVEYPGGLELDGQALVWRPYAEIVAFLRARDPRLLARTGQVLSVALGLEYADGTASPDGMAPAVQVTAFAEGYPVDDGELEEPEARAAWAYEPGAGVGPLRFGMGRDEAHRALSAWAGEELEFEVMGHDPDCEYCAAWDLRLYFERATGGCNAVEFFWPPRSPQVVLMGRRLLGHPEDGLVEWLKALDPALDFDDGSQGYVSPRYGLYFASNEQFGRVDNLAVFSKHWPPR
ncbi:hypothetical protein Mterra_02438 [Calidithermus terrae]|uniref:Uncharacterized protein n=1 Tax=Calidithermus terrae TaxID=1408545 RepID=A0A399EKW2_9DEIN|nr:hypothetical protein [Calidithermus terrae]RIH83032.1 hypothetical protein Mterra_02438 [Calidithermus terrae]